MDKEKESTMTMNDEDFSDALDINNTNSFDLAAGLHETAINDFADSHHKADYVNGKKSLYRGEGEIPDLGVTKWIYDINEPAVFDLHPINRSNSIDLARKWLLSVPEMLKLSNNERDLMTDAMANEPNITLKIPNINFEVHFGAGTSIPDPIQVSMKVVAQGRITLSENHEYRFVPYSIEIDEGEALEQSIIQAIKDKGLEPVDSPTLTGNGACYPLDKLVRHVIQVFINSRLERFVVNLPLPSAIDLFEDVRLTDIRLTLEDNWLIATASAESVVNSSQTTNIPQHVFRQDLESINMTESVAVGHPKGIEAIREQLKSNKSLEEFEREESTGQAQELELPGSDHNLYLYMSERFLQKIANNVLHKDDGDSDRDNGRNTQSKWSWSMKLRPGNVRLLSPHTIRMGFSFSAKGSAKARLKTHCGWSSWFGTSLVGHLVPKSNYVGLSAKVSSHNVKLRLDTRPSAVVFKPKTPWDLLGWILSAILTTVGTVVFNALDFLLNFLQITVATIPQKFPGTNLSFEAKNVETGVSKEGLYGIAMKLDFKA